jgi:WD40 repeat protein
VGALDICSIQRKLTMIRKSLLRNLTAMSLIFVVAACGGAHSADSPLIPNLSSATPAVSNAYTVLSPTLILSPTQPAIPTPEIIEPANAGRVMELAKLGKGTILSHPFDAPEGMPIYSPDGMWMAIPTSAGIYIYDASSLEELRRIPVGTPFIAFSPDSSLLATSERGAVSLWDPATGARVGELPGGSDDVHWELTFSPEGSLLAAVTWHREVSVWSVASGERLFAFPGDRLRFSPDSELAVAVVYGENRVHLYETRGGTEVNKWNVRNAGFTPGGQLWLEDNATVRLAYIDRDLVTAPFSGVQPSFSADGTLMALFANGQISLYEHQQGRRVQMLEGSYVQIDGVLFSPDGQTLAGDVFTLHCPTCSEFDGLDRYLVLWRAADGTIISRMDHPFGWIAYSMDGRLVAAVQMENARIVKAADGSVANRIEGFIAPVSGMALSPHGNVLAAVHATNPYTLRLWDLESGRVVRTLQGRDDASAETNWAMAYSPEGDYLAVDGDLWDLVAGKQLTEMEQAITAVTSCRSSGVAFAPEGDVLATGCFEGQLDLWSFPDGELLQRIGGYSSWVEDLVYSPNGNTLAAIYGVPDFLVQVWQLPKGTAYFTLTGGHFTRVAYSAVGRTLATIVAINEHEQFGGPAGFVQLWSASDGKELVRLEVEDAVSIAFSPDSRILATGSLDGTLRLWEIAGGTLLMEANGHYEQIQRVLFTPDGTSLVSGSLDGSILMWGIPSAP